MIFKSRVCFICMILFLLMVISGCFWEISDDTPRCKSVPVIFTDDETAVFDAITEDRFFEFLGKTHADGLAQEHFESISESKDALIDMDSVDRITTKLTINGFTLDRSRYASEFFLDNEKYNINSMIENGCYAIIPRNPFTGEDVKTSLEYSPGDFLIAMNGKVRVHIYHMGLIDCDCYIVPEGYDNLYDIQLLENDEHYLTDGRTKYNYRIYDENTRANEIKETMRIRGFHLSMKYVNEYEKLDWLKTQMYQILSRYSYDYEDVLPTLEDYLNYFGRKNPAAWVNPYTGKPMKQMEKFAVCEYITSDVTDLLDRPTLTSEEAISEYINKYAGNYSFAIVEGKNGPKAVFTIYFINYKDKLESLTCFADPMSDGNREVREWRKKDRQKKEDSKRK